MAHFRGTVKGGRGEASRLGHKSSGLHVIAKSWEGHVDVTLYYNEAKGCDYARIAISNPSGTTCIYNGRVAKVARLRSTLGDE